MSQVDPDSSGELPEVVQAGPESTSAPRRRLLLPVAAAVALVAAGAAGWALGVASAGPGYDEDAHRAALTQLFNEPADWDAYRDANDNMCALDDQAFGYYVAMSLDDGSADRTRLDVEFGCPLRLDEFWDVVLLPD